MVTKQILEIAKEIRQDVIDLFGETAGVCDNACSRLEQRLKAEGQPCRTKIGYFRNSEDEWFHWWIEIDDFILDITADQFGLPEIVFAPKKELPQYDENV